MKNKTTVKGFKGFNNDLTCRGFQYEVGKTYKTDRDISLCDWGFHFCRKMLDVNSYYSFDNENNRYCEIEAVGQIIDGDDKSVTNKIKIVREIPKEEFIELINTGYKNSGYCNTGDWNTGNRNTGNRNTGYCNTGDWNTGYCNTGNRNTGNRNTGYWNTGDWNTGDWNTGDWNKTDRSSGVFCTETPKLIMFNKETDMSFDEWRNTRAYDVLCDVPKSKWIYFDDMTKEEKIKFPSAKTCGGYLKELTRKEASQEWWNSLDKYDKQEIFSLPNFDLEIFNEIMELNIESID